MALTRRAWLAGGLAATLLLLKEGAAGASSRVDLAAVILTGRDVPFGYNDTSPGPVLRGEIGKPLNLRLANKLSDSTSLAFPGCRSFNSFCGLTAAPIAAGAETDIVVTPADAGFGLYLPYGPASAAKQLSAGLFGAFVVDEPNPPAVDLDAFVVFSLADETLRANALTAPSKMTVPKGGRVRLRLANATSDRILELSVTGVQAQIIAIDGAPSAMFTPRDGRFPLAPSARVELMFDAADGADIAIAETRAGPMLQFGTAGPQAPARPPIAPLPENPRLPKEIALERAQRVTVNLTETAGRTFAVNGVHAKDWPEKPLFKAARGSPVTLTLNNKTAAAQTLRLEGHISRQLHALDDGWDPYWRDALLVGPGKTVHAAFLADAPGKWPLASASPETRAAGMLAWFLVS